MNLQYYSLANNISRNFCISKQKLYLAMNIHRTKHMLQILKQVLKNICIKVLPTYLVEESTPTCWDYCLRKFYLDMFYESSFVH